MTTSPISLHLKEWTHLAPTDPGSQLTGVFLEDDASVKKVVSQLSAQRMLTISELRAGLSIETTSYVGRIRLGNIQITIHPKITGAPLVHLLRYAYGLRDLKTSNEVAFGGEHQAFQELLIQQLIEEVSELVARGLHRRYVRTDRVLANPRGRIDLQRIAKQGGVIQATLPCTYYPRLDDCLINQVVLQGLHLAARLTDELQQDLYARDRTLWDKRISNEQQYLKSRNAAAQSRMRLDISRQKLAAPRTFPERDRSPSK